MIVDFENCIFYEDKLAYNVIDHKFPKLMIIFDPNSFPKVLSSYDIQVQLLSISSAKLTHSQLY